jgi:4-amino-4-deoxy-L-arabinose transferase-like glycosyltransferase
VTAAGIEPILLNPRPPRCPRWHHVALRVAVMLVACATALTGVGSTLPLDSHEVFVARAAEEMVARGSWLVPYFDDKPRLQKPPMNYWLALGVNALDLDGSGGGRVTEFEARLPSALAGLACVALTMVLGTSLAGRGAGALAGLLMASTAGFVNYTHSARPEMTYAAFCLAAIMAFTRSWQRAGASPRWAWLGWLALGGAMLTKGPQVPAAIVAGFALALLTSGRKAEIARILRPASGITIFLLASMWWYAAIYGVVPDAPARWKAETLDRYDADGSEWWSLLNPYYVYRTAGLAMPWVALYPLALAAPWLGRLKGRAQIRLMWWVVAAGMLVLSLSLGRRWYYMLPLLGPVCVLMAAGAIEATRILQQRQQWRLWQSIMAAHGACVVAAILWLALEQTDRQNASLTVLFGAVALAGAVIVAMRRFWPIHQRAATFPAAALCLLSAAVLIGATARGTLWRSNRFAHRELGWAIARHVAAGQEVLGWRQEFDIELYYGRTGIEVCDTADELSEEVADDEQTWLLVDARIEPPRWPANAHATMTSRVNYEGIDGCLQLWRLTTRPAVRIVQERR